MSNEEEHFPPVTEPTGEEDHHQPQESSVPADNGDEAPGNTETTAETDSTTVLVKNLGETPIEELRSYFSQFGEIREILIPTHRKTHERRQFGFIVYITMESAEAAVKTNSKPIFNGRELSIEIAKEKRKTASEMRDRYGLPPLRGRGGGDYRGGRSGGGGGGGGYSRRGGGDYRSDYRSGGRDSYSRPSYDDRRRPYDDDRRRPYDDRGGYRPSSYDDRRGGGSSYHHPSSSSSSSGPSYSRRSRSRDRDSNYRPPRSGYPDSRDDRNAPSYRDDRYRGTGGGYSSGSHQARRSRSRSREPSHRDHQQPPYYPNTSSSSSGGNPSYHRSDSPRGHHGYDRPPMASYSSGGSTSGGGGSYYPPQQPPQHYQQPPPQHYPVEHGGRA